MKTSISFMIFIVFYFAVITNALHCYKCGHLSAVGDGIESNKQHISMFPSFDKSCKTSSTPHIRFLSVCGDKSSANTDAWCVKVFSKGIMKRLPMEVNTTLRDCVKFPVGWSEGCNDWTKADLLNSESIPLDLKKLAAYFTANFTMSICTCKTSGCDFKPGISEPTQMILGSFWRTIGNAGVHHHHYAYGKRISEFTKKYLLKQG